MLTYTLPGILVADYDDCLSAARAMAAAQVGDDLGEFDAYWLNNHRDTIVVETFEALSAPFVFDD